MRHGISLTWNFLSFFTFSSSAFCAIQITLPGQIYAATTVVANYTRDPSDSIPQSISKVKEDTDDGASLVSVAIEFSGPQVNQASDGLSGSIELLFNRAG
jgi:hypothetical protein